METAQQITARINASFHELTDGGRSATHSWEHCYNFFSNVDPDLELASLHLAFYLASWGMYRGSAAIRNYDYLVHGPIAGLLLKAKYNTLRGASLDVLLDNFDGLLWPLVERLRVPGLYPDGVNVTDTLATKILLGTLGCTPAYDRYFKRGLAQCGLPQSFTQNNFRTVLQFCMYQNEGFVNAQATKPEYPIMRVIDMYFHGLGRQ